jgi:hypothetical protein
VFSCSFRCYGDVMSCVRVFLFVMVTTQVALKSMMVIHRTLREGDPTFREELINYGRNRGHILNISNFKDDSSPHGASTAFPFHMIAVCLYLVDVVICYFN